MHADNEWVKVLESFTGRSLILMLNMEKSPLQAGVSGTLLGRAPDTQHVWMLKTRPTPTEQGIMPSGVLYFHANDVIRVFDNSDAAASTLIA